MKTYKNLYPKIYDRKNLVLAWKKARKGKTKKKYVIEFEKELGKNLLQLYDELKSQTYAHRPLETFILRYLKTLYPPMNFLNAGFISFACCCAMF